MRSGSSSEPRARTRWPQLSSAVTVPVAAVVLIAGIAFVQLADGPHPTITQAPTQRLVAVTVTTPRVAKPVCRQLVHLGDSNLALASERFKAKYRAAGVEAVIDTASVAAPTS